MKNSYLSVSDSRNVYRSHVLLVLNLKACDERMSRIKRSENIDTCLDCMTAD